MMFQTQKALDEVGDKVSADEKQKVQAEIDSLKALLDSTPMDDITDTQKRFK